MARTLITRKKKKTATTISNDYINTLQDEILILILSFLPTDQAVRTSVLSPRWRELWKYTQIIEFNYQTTPHLPLSAIDQALRSHQAPTCREIRIRMRDSGYAQGPDIAKWFRFAANKLVERIDLFLLNPKPFLQGDSYSISTLSFSNFSSLKRFCLHSWTVSSANIEYILKNCPNLEEMIIYGSHHTFNLKVSSNSLKRLEILSCCLLEELELNAENLVSFTYWGPDIKISFNNVPLLHEVSVIDTYCRSLAKCNFKQFSPVLEQLKTLKLTMSFPWFVYFPQVYNLRNVKNLELSIKVWSFEKVFNLFSSVVEGLPSLNKIKIHLFWPENFKDSGGFDPMSKYKYHRHHCLRSVELVGFMGGLLEIEIVEYLIKNAVWLESLKVRVCREASMDEPEDLMDDEEKEGVTGFAQEIGTMVQPHTKFVVL